MSTKTLLCVDNEPQSLKIRAMLLEFAGYRVITATSLSDADRLLRRKPADAVLIDHGMVWRHSTEAASLRKCYPSVPFLMLSEHSWPPDEARSLADDHFHKGDAPELLLSKIAELTRVKRPAIPPPPDCFKQQLV